MTRGQHVQGDGNRGLRGPQPASVDRTESQARTMKSFDAGDGGALMIARAAAQESFSNQWNYLPCLRPGCGPGCELELLEHVGVAIRGGGLSGDRVA